MTYSRLANPRETRAVLEGFGLATKHRLGQNFLVNDEVIGRIANLAELDGDDVVLEVGPGIVDVGLGYPRLEPWRRMPPLWPHALLGPMPAARGSAKCLPSALLLGRQGHIVVALGAAGLRHRWSPSHSDPLTLASFHRDSKRTRHRCHGQRHPPL